MAMTVELRTGTSRSARPEDYITKITAVAPAPAGTACPLWTTFLDRVTDHKVELQDFLRRYMGYCLTGATTEHVLVFLYGTGANGKSVFVNTVVGIFNDYATVRAHGSVPRHRLRSAPHRDRQAGRRPPGRGPGARRRAALE
jgi:putative DNA primase/helicase